MLAILIIGPWALALLYDLLLYLWRFATYELPYFGGRARGHHRPRAPSLTERPDGHRRQISFTGISRLRADSGENASATRSGGDVLHSGSRAPYEFAGDD